ncbi:MAG: hypothetical protein N2749_01665 [Clostridia bacterium]|nr:hypothetical protein [Clostridia bacterium]
MKRLKKHKNTIKVLEEIFQNEDKYLIIHYSCESFYKDMGSKSSRITCIAVRFLKTGQTKSFSIHMQAELKGIKLEEIINHYDELEREMLQEFLEFLKKNRKYIWIHLNMRDVHYGFDAILFRYRVLNRGKRIDYEIYTLEDENKIDLARILIAKYGVNYINHPRFESLIKKNNISNKDFLNGQEEADAFENHEYIKLHRSTLRKVDCIANIIERAHENTLKTNSNWKDLYGFTPYGFLEMFTNKWWVKFIILPFMGILFWGIIGDVVVKFIVNLF